MSVGPVDYNYRISQYEVTNADYIAMLNDVVAYDPYGLYISYMGTPKWDPVMGEMVQYGGITREQARKK